MAKEAFGGKKAAPFTKKGAAAAKKGVVKKSAKKGKK